MYFYAHKRHKPINIAVIILKPQNQILRNKVMNIIRTIFFAFLLSVLFVGCEQKPAETTTTEDKSLEDNIEMDAGELSEDIINLLVNIPSPREGSKLLKEAGAVYEQNLLNAENKVNNYRTRSEQSLALGVYTADLSYAAVYGKKDIAYKYLSAMRNLADQLSIGNVFDKKLEVRLKDNAENQDSLDRIFDDTFDSLTEQLKKTKQISVQSLMFAGTWIETAHMASEHWKISAKPSIKKQILERRSTLDDIIKILASAKNDDGQKKVHDALVELQKEFDLPEGTTDLTDEQATKIHAKIKKLRTEIVK